MGGEDQPFSLMQQQQRLPEAFLPSAATVREINYNIYYIVYTLVYIDTKKNILYKRQAATPVAKPFETFLCIYIYIM